MKKIFPILLCVLLIGALAFSVSADGSSVALTPSATTLERGDTFTIVASLTNSDPIKLGTVALDYDTNVFEMTGGTCHVAGANPALVLPAQKVGTFLLGAETAVSGQIFTFNFKVKADAAFGTYTFTPTAAIGISTGDQIPATSASVTVACNHTYGAWTKLDDNKHQQICTKCGDKKEEDHDWLDGVGNPAPTCTTPGVIESTCMFCNATKTENVGELGHAWDNKCDTTCNNNCGTVRPAEHSYAMSSDASNHWQECSSCNDKKDVAAHTPGPEPTATSAQLCTVCNYEIKPALAHTHVLEKEWTTDSNYHWHRCETRNPACYYTADKAKHVYDDDCDVTCNTCAYIREAPHKYKPEWQGNADGHWQICSACNAKSQVFEHVPGPEATMDTDQTCEECGFVIKMRLSHVHDFGDTWYSDDESHWQSCAECTESTALEPHEWDEGVEQADGKLLYTCAVCSKQVISDGPMDTQPSTLPTTQPPVQKPTEPSDSGRFPWQWAGIAAVILLIIGVVLLVIEFIRSRKSNMHGKFSK